MAQKEGAVNGTLLEAFIMCYLGQQGPDWLLNRNQKSARKGGAGNGTLLEALIMCNYCARSYLKIERKKTKLRLRWTTGA
jgi:hypothetical protein